MIYPKRLFQITFVDTEIELINNLKLKLQPLNSGFKYENLYFFNDSNSVTSNLEFAVFIFEENIWYQIDTLSTCLMSVSNLSEIINKLLVGQVPFKKKLSISLEV